jgi:hypothetical protein
LFLVIYIHDYLHEFLITVQSSRAKRGKKIYSQARTDTRFIVSPDAPDNVWMSRGLINLAYKNKQNTLPCPAKVGYKTAFVCTGCYKTYLTKKSLLAHMKKPCNSLRYSFYCFVCCLTKDTPAILSLDSSIATDLTTHFNEEHLNNKVMYKHIVKDDSMIVFKKV